uniref:peptidylprolyl isomerase n=1 Tax=Chromera velia CCMP2878 TaxID=1169474 RepID=A0A0G4I2V5_9ALVE|mmetsp:Transcript_20359/g.40762  ORF Transcript_20359/g.40762 Transcript_20359/m.40762 type:complete len:185 (+) Transcript_20359:451-1005(+)|eukprot:Cvel_10440.t1-p1 / transcript=Cvel_10440.t1 / gene=Cvel_10440 / organism=Chromera_velia_CCMP2878 / gene_product=Peptidyl-prolyl cis-trans isomerase FKBP4, putative / transcript_product=Peptidyl-prolyl cis-trans isomerase FKBP4, putative / location=Cvel_scaffold628:73414-73965(-) / protein_length=184 / sequence_SO=supercontig / SO=protein_coding / is_pseudo=false
MAQSEDQFAQGREFREAGNAHFKEGRYKEALQMYWKAVMHVKPLGSDQSVASALGGAMPGMGNLGANPNASPSVDPKEVSEFLSLTYSNMAMVQLKKGDFEKALERAKEALHYNSKNDKARYRHGQASMELEDFDQAEKDFAEALQINGENKGAVAKARQQLAEKKKAFLQKKEKPMYQKMFGS